MIYTKKQLLLMKKWQRNELARINLLEGSVSSGKTWISLVLWAFWVKTMPLGKQYMMCAKSLTTLKRNCLVLLEELVGSSNFSYSITKKEGVLFGRRILLEGAADIRSEAKIRGLTLQGAYCDELTQFPRDFFAMLLSRLREPGAKLFATTNPDSPSHWLKVDYIDRKADLDFLDVKFLLDDNTTLPEDYVRNIKMEYTGVFYDRFILGKWVIAEGLIYPMYEDALCEPPHALAEKYVLSIDYGTQNAFAGLLWGLYGGVWYQLQEYYYSGRAERIQKTDDEYANDLDVFLESYDLSLFGSIAKGRLQFLQGGKIQTIVDPSAASFIATLRKRSYYKVLKANNDVLDGIRDTATALQLGKLKINPNCKNTVFEMSAYTWQDGGSVDAPKKENDHACDATRYFVYTTGLIKHKKRGVIQYGV